MIPVVAVSQELSFTIAFLADRSLLGQQAESGECQHARHWPNTIISNLCSETAESGGFRERIAKRERGGREET
jgi:hypothetical protein